MFRSLRLSVFILFYAHYSRSASPDVQSKVYHIVTSQNGRCNEDPCLTLPQLEDNFSNYRHSNTSLIFLPGNHSLEREFSVSNVSKLSLHSPANRSTQARISCHQFGRINFSNIERLLVVDLEFIGCSISLLSVPEGVFKASTFIGAYIKTAVELVNSLVVIVNCTLSSNSFGNYRDNYRVGGGIVALKSNVTISWTSLFGNTAEIGGAIYTEDSTVAIFNSSFVENIASCPTNKEACWHWLCSLLTF